MELTKLEWIEIAKLIGSGLFGFLTSTIVFLWKERKESRDAAHEAYHEALSVASKSAEAATAGSQMIYEIIQEIQASSRASDLVEVRKSFQLAAVNIYEPNQKVAVEFYQELYKMEKEPDLKTARYLLKKARHFLQSNESGNRALIGRLGLVRFSLQLGSNPRSE